MTPREASRVREVLRELLGLGDLPQYGRSIIENLLKEMEAETPETKAKTQRQEFDELRREVKAIDVVLRGIEKIRRPSPEEAAKRLLAKVREDAGKRIPLGPAFGRGTPPREKSEDDPRLGAMVDQLMEKVRKVKRTGVRGGV